MTSRATLADSGAGSGTLGSYLTGFTLAVVLTVIPFAVVMSGAVVRPLAIVVVFASAILQILVHLHYFLHLSPSSAARWNLMAIVFTGVIILILVGGSLWVMADLHGRTVDQAALPPATIGHRLG